MRVLVACLLIASAAVAEDAPETLIEVPSPIAKGFLIAWKPSYLTLGIDSGSGRKYGSGVIEPLRMLARYTTTGFGDKFMLRAEIEGGRFQTDPQQGGYVGSDGWDMVARLLAGTATRVTPALTITASAGLITRYQRGRAESGAPEIGVFGVTSNAEVEYRFAPVLTIAGFVEGGLAPFPYLSQNNLGVLSDVSEVKARLQLSVDVAPTVALDVGYEFTRWHASFSGSPVLGDAADRALLIESREHALTLGIRFKP